MIRHVTEIHQEVDVVLPADHTLIAQLMYPSRVPGTAQPYATWYVEFATNRLALAYTARSRYAEEVGPDNWYEVISRPGVKVGIAEPRLDACGYRALTALQLAESYYGRPTILEDLLMGCCSVPITVGELDGRAVIHVPEVLEPRKDSGILLRGSSIQLIALLESGDVDYAFEYESVIRQHGLELVPLPDEVNLGSEEHADLYDTVEVRLDFQRFASVRPEFRGETIGYGVTVPSDAPHPAQAEEFVAFLLGPEGQAVLAGLGHPLIIPPRASHYDALPEALKGLCVEMP